MLNSHVRGAEDRRADASDLLHETYKTGPTTQLNHEALTGLVADLLAKAAAAEGPQPGDSVVTEWNARMRDGRLHDQHPMSQSYARECAERDGWTLLVRERITRPTIITPWRDA